MTTGKPRPMPTLNVAARQSSSRSINLSPKQVPVAPSLLHIEVEMALVSWVSRSFSIELPGAAYTTCRSEALLQT